VIFFLSTMTHKYTDPRPTCVTDTECYVNYWSIAFKCVETARVVHTFLTKDRPLDTARIAKIFKNWRVVTFNGIGYDMPMIALAMSGATNGELKRASDDIIMADLKPWQFFDKYGVELPGYIDHIDLMEVSPGSPARPSLKMYAGRLHSKRMQDLPFEPDRVLSDDDIVQLDSYRDNDLDVTRDKYFELKPQIELRAQMSEQYGTDLRSKSDAQVAEAIIKTEIERISKRKINRPEVVPGTFRYTAPEWVQFQTPRMQEILRRITTTPFLVKSNGQVELPAFLTDAKIVLGASEYTMGIGGLHSNEKSAVHLSDDDFVLLDNDVTSYYPSMIINNKWSPRHIGDAFTVVYKNIYESRIYAKARAKELGDEIKKIEKRIKELENDK